MSLVPAWRIRLRRYAGLDPLCDERRDRLFLMPLENWEGTYISLTGKDLSKVSHMPTEVWEVDPQTPVGDMAIANRALRARSSEERERAIGEYLEGLVAYRDLLADPGLVGMPELLADPAASRMTESRVRWSWNRENPSRSLELVARPRVAKDPGGDGPAPGLR